MKILESKVVEKIWWYGLNIITTLLIVSFINVNGPAGSSGLPGSNGQDGVDGQGGNTTYPVRRVTTQAAPVGGARAAYAQSLVNQGYIALDSVEDFSIFTASLLGENLYGNQEAFSSDKRYVLTSDIDFDVPSTGYLTNQIAPFYLDENRNANNLYFRGVFDGAGFSIRNFTMNTGEYEYPVAFFPYTGLNAVIKNITFENIEVSNVLTFNDGHIVGGVIGYVDGPTYLENVTVKDGTVVATSYAGGIVGQTNDDIYLVNVRNENTSVFAPRSAGGLIGSTDVDGGQYHIFIQDSVNTSTLDSRLLPAGFEDYIIYDEDNNQEFYPDHHVGGLIGELRNQESLIILDSVNTGSITSEEGQVGGLIGYVGNVDLFVIANSFNVGFVQSLDAEAGGLVGDLATEERIYIQNSYNAGQIYSKEDAVGGLIGELGSTETNFVQDAYGDDLYLSAVTTYITNSYNAGFISTGNYLDSEKGGLVGEVNNGRHLIVTNSFNVGTFSASITNVEYSVFLERNGAIIGDPEGNVALENVAFYVDESQQDQYLDHPLNRLHPSLATRMTDRSMFEETNFMFEGSWDLNTIWMFGDDGYTFPRLRQTPFHDAKENTLFAVTIEQFELWDYRVQFSEAVDGNIVVFTDMSAVVYDVETPLDELNSRIFATLTPSTDYRRVMGDGDLVASFTHDLYTWEDPLTYRPTQGSGEYYLYVIAIDSDGNVAMSDQEVTFMFEEGSGDNLPPVPGNDGVLVAGFNNFNLASLDVNFEAGTDDMTAVEDLQYFLIITVDGFDFDAWDGDFNDAGILFRIGVNPGLTTSINIEQAGIQFNVNYHVTILISDTSLYALYQIYDLTFID